MEDKLKLLSQTFGIAIKELTQANAPENISAQVSVVLNLQNEVTQAYKEWLESKESGS